MKIVSLIVFLFVSIFAGDSIAEEKCENELQDLMFQSKRSEEFLNFAIVETDGYLKCITIFPKENNQKICKKIKISAEGLFLAYSVMLKNEENSRAKTNTCLFKDDADQK